MLRNAPMGSFSSIEDIHIFTTISGAISIQETDITLDNSILPILFFPTYFEYIYILVVMQFRN